ncbi:uncharacterized protein A4U43_C04F10660 [Asparagus officinalis]|uniref:Uncharacterized protein n=1 Tax=Asparagus officinalis TaxID=4686 RepID=A0A5P1EZU7_ASPOF|nr:uncharacterized protein A4U43_C04F10660 [Asparagus officinalis]
MRRSRGAVNKGIYLQRRNTEKKSIRRRRRTKKKEKVKKGRTKTEAEINTRRKEIKKKSTKTRKRTKTRIKHQRFEEKLSIYLRLAMKIYLDLTSRRLRKLMIPNLRRSLEEGSEMMNKRQQISWSKIYPLQLIKESRTLAVQLVQGKKILQAIKWLQMSLVQYKEGMKNSHPLLRNKQRALGLQLIHRSKKFQIAKRLCNSILQSKEERRFSPHKCRKELRVWALQLLWRSKELQVMRRLELLLLQSKKETMLQVTPWIKFPFLYEELRAYSLSIQCAKGKSGPVINMVSNSIRSTTKRNDGIEQSTRSLTSSVPRKFEDMGAAPATEKERSSFPNITRTEQRTEGLPMGKSTEKKAEGMEKTKEKKSEDEKKEGHKKRKEKDKDRHKEKKKEEKKREKEDKHKKHDKLKESEIKDQIGSLNNKTLGPRVETINTITADGINKKRKEFERNGFLHEPQIDGRPNKLQRTSASSNSTVENGRPLELIPNTKLEAINHFKNERGLDNNGNHLNGKVKIQPSDVCRPPIVPPPITVDSSKKDQIPSIKPHPDTKYLSTIYSVPKMVELMESDEQDWLFSSESPRSSTKLKADGATPQVWAKGQQIEAADIFALPYVIPY